jgi:hypothetical protein
MRALSIVLKTFERFPRASESAIDISAYLKKIDTH